jgi:hypothetical protein
MNVQQERRDRRCRRATACDRSDQQPNDHRSLPRPMGLHHESPSRESPLTRGGIERRDRTTRSTAERRIYMRIAW